MAESNKKSELVRLEDFIELARKGKSIELDIKLRKQFTIQKTDSSSAESSSDIDTYLLIADYVFRFDGQMHKISKVYMFAATTDSIEKTDKNADIANLRLKVDYERLKAVDIAFSEKLF